MIWVVTVKDVKDVFKFYLFQAAHLMLPGLLPCPCPLPYSDLLALVCCYVTVMIGFALGCAGGTSNGNSGRSKPRSKLKRRCFVLLEQVLTDIKRLLCVHLFTFLFFTFLG